MFTTGNLVTLNNYNAEHLPIKYSDEITKLQFFSNANQQLPLVTINNVLTTNLPQNRI